VSVWGDLIDRLEEAGYGHGMTREERDRAADRRLGKLGTVRVTLPDGKAAVKHTTTPYRYAVAVLTDTGWQPFRWVIERDLPRAIADASKIYPETQTLEVD
jgi:hypothetical protein